MNISYILSLVLVVFIFSNQALADRENDMWQQFKAQKASKELDAEFEEARPEPIVIERIIERVVVQPAPAPVVIVQHKPEPVVIAQPEPIPEMHPAPVSHPSLITVEMDGYIFRFGACKLAHKNIKCRLTITSLQKDGELTLYAKSGGRSSKLFDRNGNELQPSNINMGNKSTVNRVRNKYISGVTAKGSVEFGNVDSGTNSIAMFELSLHNHTTRNNKRIQFRDVPLSL